MIFAIQLTVIVVLFAEVVIRTRPVLGGNCFSPNRKISSQARENRGHETNTNNRTGNGQTQSLTPRRTPPRYLHPPQSIGIMPAASYFSLFRSRSAPSTVRRSPSRPSSLITSSLEPVSVSGPMMSTTSVQHSSRLSTTPEERLAALRERAFSGTSARRNRSRLASGLRQNSMPELPFSVVEQAANSITEAGGSAPSRVVRRNNRAPELRHISVVTEDGIGRREIMVRPRPTPHHRRNSSPTISPKDRPTAPPLPIIREGTKEEE